MIRKEYLIIGVAAALFTVHDSGATAPAEVKPGKGAKEAPFTHVVIFQLKKDAEADAVKNLIADSHTMLEKIPSVRGLKVGPPSEKSKGPVVAQNYQVGLLVLFDDFEGMKAYTDHEQHKGFVSKHAKNFEKVTVYDFVNQPK